MTIYTPNDGVTHSRSRAAPESTPRARTRGTPFPADPRIPHYPRALRAILVLQSTTRSTVHGIYIKPLRSLVSCVSNEGDMTTQLWKQWDPVNKIIFPGSGMRATYDKTGRVDPRWPARRG